MEEEIKKELEYWDGKQVSIFINSNIPNCKKVIKETKDLIKTELKTYTQNILKAQNKELERKIKVVKSLQYNLSDEMRGEIWGYKKLIEENNKIINNLK